MRKTILAAVLAAGFLLSPVTATPAQATAIDRTPAPSVVWCPPWCKAMPYLSYLCPQPRVCG